MAEPTNLPLGLTPMRNASSMPSGKVPIGVFELLAEQHRELFELLRQAGLADGAVKREQRWSEVRRRLISHERAEAEVVYRSLDKQDYSRAIVGRHATQAAELETAVAELAAVDIESDAWLERLRDLMAMVDDHVRDEEHDFFPLAQRVLGDRAAIDLRERYESAQRDLLHELANERH